MLRYAWWTLRARRAGFVGAFLALCCAAALVTACGGLLETGLRGEIRTERYAAAPVVVAADQNVHHEQRKGDKVKHKAKPVSERAWLPTGTAAAVAAVPGVGEVVPEVTFPAVLVGAEGGPEPLGHAWSSAALTPFTIEDGGRAPEADGEIVVDAGLARRAAIGVGDAVTVQATDAPAEYTVVGVAAGAISEQAAIFFAEDEARRLAGHQGRDTVVGVFPAAGVSADELAGRIGDALGDASAVVRTGGERGEVEFLDAAQARVRLVSMGGAIGGTGLLVAVLVVVGTLALATQQRRRELALLRAIAATPRQTRRLIGREALIVGLVAGVCGAVAGQPLAALLHARLTELGAVPETLERVSSPFPAAAAVLATLFAAWLAARLAARRTARIRPAEALAESAVDVRGVARGRLLAGGLVLAGGVVLLVVLSALRTEPAATPVTYLAVLVLCVAVALLGPVLARGAFAALGVPLRLSRVSGHLAAHNARAGARRLAAVITPLTLLVAMAAVIVFSQTTLGAAAERQARDGVVAELAVVPEGGLGVPGSAAERLRAEPGVTAVTEVSHTEIRTPGLDKYRTQAVTSGPGLAETLDLGVVDGSLTDLDADGVAVSELVADHHGLRPGDPFPLVLGDNTPVTPTVVAVYERRLGFGDITLDRGLVAAHVDNPLAEAALVATEEGVDAARLATAVGEFPGLAVRDGGALADQVARGQRTNAEVAFLGMGLVLAFTTIAAVNTLAMATADRAREFALLRLIGTSRRQVLRMLRLESLTVAATAVLLGTGIALATLAAFSGGMTGRVAPAVSPAGYALLVAAVVGLALLATAIPARVALRAAPAREGGARVS
ncbi:ABC transporter permease [Streptomyces sp. 8K308]|uniref:ABC transporter permease n=1 Tax=Streptomyces sp. 8K308 TaxID=2530388 RepID=UPI001A9E4FC5|nr:ABC transporter permease [Streptomyces sp. 8K308]